MYSNNSIDKKASPRDSFEHAFDAADDLINEPGITNLQMISAFEQVRDCFFAIHDLNTQYDRDAEIIDDFHECMKKLIARYLVLRHTQCVRNLFTEVEDTNKKIKRCEREFEFFSDKAKAMDVQAYKWGFLCHPIAPDGNCLFHAISHQLKINKIPVSFTGQEELHLALRNIAVNHIKINSAYFQTHLTDLTIAKYVERMARTGEWGDNFEIIALARELNITLVVVQDQGEVFVFKTRNNQPIVFLGFEKNYLHYTSLIKSHEIEQNPDLPKLISKAEEIERTDQLYLKQPVRTSNQQIQSQEKKTPQEKNVVAANKKSSKTSSVMAIASFFSKKMSQLIQVSPVKEKTKHLAK